MTEPPAATQRRLGPTSASAPSFPLAGVELAGPAMAALRSAARRVGPDGELGTGAVLAALERNDPGGSWDRMWLRIDHGGAASFEHVPDPSDEPLLPAPRNARWGGVALSPALAASLVLLRDMARDYDMRPVPPGALALALMCEPTSAVSSTLPDGSDKFAMLEIVQEELLGVTLDGFGDWVARKWTERNTPAQRAMQQARAAAAAGHRPPDELDLVHALITGIKDQPATPPFVAMLQHVLYDAVELARRLPSRALDDVLASIAATEDELQLLAAVTHRPSPACTALLSTAGLTGPGVAADARKLQSDRSDRAWTDTRAFQRTVLLGVILTIAVPVLVVVHVLGPGAWWQLATIPFLLFGAPTSTAVVPMAMVAVLLLLGAPVPAGVQLVRCGVDWHQTRLELRRLRAMTGVRLGAVEYSKHLRRGIRPGPQIARSRFFAAHRIRRLEKRAGAVQQ